MRSTIVSFVGFILAASIVVGPSRAQAVPPATVTGIDVTTVLTLDERARRFSFELDPSKPDADRLANVDTVVIDPGHGGTNLGALGVADIQEKYLTLELAYRLRDRLQAAHPHLRVLLTRYWDASVSLTERIHFANLVDADLFMSLHYNAAGHRRAWGFETYFLSASEVTPGQDEKKGRPIATAKNVVTGIDQPATGQTEGAYNDALLTLKRDLQRERQHTESGRFAETIQAQLSQQLDSPNRGVKQANFGVLRGALMPAVVIESGFLTHPKEGRRVVHNAHRGHVVDALVSAVEQFDDQLAERDQH